MLKQFLNASRRYRGYVQQIWLGPAVSQLSVMTDRGEVVVYVATRLIKELNIVAGHRVFGSHTSLSVGVDRVRKASM